MSVVQFHMGELETEAEKTRTRLMDHLHKLADQLDNDGDVTLDLSGQPVTLKPTNSVT